LELDYDIRLDGRVLGYALLLSLATALACGLYPALRAGAPDLTIALKGSDARKSGRAWFRGGLLLAQIAVSQFLLAGAGLLFRSYLAQQRIEPGFDTGRNLVAAMVVGMERPLNLGQLRDKWRSVPGVNRASWAMRLPLAASGGGMRKKVSVPGVTPAPLDIGWTGVGPDYFSIMGTRLLRGREFREFEPGSPAVVNAQMARQFWGGPDAAMGRLFRAEGRDYQIVGIAEDGRYSGLLEQTQPWFFVPSNGGGEHVLIAEIAGNAGAIMPEARKALNEAFPDVKILTLTTLREHLRIAYFTSQNSAGLMAALALLGVLLASVGLYAAISNNVNRRAHEIGVRISVGARPWNVAALVMRQTAWVVGAGCAAGLLAAFAVARIFSAMLYKVSPADPAAVVVSVLAVVAVAALAAYSPARRAIRLDPMTVLRKE
jgi:predicted permease